MSTLYLLTKPIDAITGNLPTLSDHDSRLYIRDDSGGLLVGCFEPMGKPIAPGALRPVLRLGAAFVFQQDRGTADAIRPS